MPGLSDSPCIATQTKDSDNSSDPSKEETTPASAEKEEAASVPPLKVEFMKLDLASLQSTMDFVNAYKAKGYPLHVLICNAGLGLVPYGEFLYQLMRLKLYLFDQTFSGFIRRICIIFYFFMDTK